MKHDAFRDILLPFQPPQKKKKKVLRSDFLSTRMDEQESGTLS